MEGRFVWLGGWPQGLGAAGGGAEFLNLYARPAGSAREAFFGLFWPKNGHPLGGRGRPPPAAPGAFLAVWSALFWAFWPKLGGKMGSFIPVPRHLFGRQIWPFVLRFLGLFGQNFGGPKKSCIFALFGQVAFFGAGLGSPFWPPAVGALSARRVVFWAFFGFQNWPFWAKTRHVEVVVVFLVLKKAKITTGSVILGLKFLNFRPKFRPSRVGFLSFSWFFKFYFFQTNRLLVCNFKKSFEVEV